jgi:hypothetical protein
MSDPVAEAAAQLAEQQVAVTREAGMMVSGQPETFVPNTETPTEAGTAAPGEPVSSPSDPAPIVGAESISAGATEPTDELPNAAPAAVESTTEPDSAPSAVGADTTYTIAASSAEPLHIRVAAHLEAIFRITKEHVEAAPNEATAHAQTVKTHIGDVLHRISNGMAVAEGELVQKLEALYRAL